MREYELINGKNNVRGRVQVHLREITYEGKYVRSYDPDSPTPMTLKEDINSLDLIIPDQKTIDRFFNIAEDFYKSKYKNFLENNKLLKIKDALIQKFISGKLNIINSEKIIKELEKQ